MKESYSIHQSNCGARTVMPAVAVYHATGILFFKISAKIFGFPFYILSLISPLRVSPSFFLPAAAAEVFSSARIG
jgi:hypothetical protein